MQKKLNHHDSLQAWLSYIEKIHPSDIKLGLDRVFQVKKFTNIVPNFPIIVIGGTNGKGSVCSFIESILYQSGLNVGCYTSPHFLRFNERIRINKKEVNNKIIVKSLSFIDNKRQDVPLTYFEITTLAAVNIFIEAKIDIAILEIGLGGRLDAVNIFDPIVSLLTTISFDHQDYLGNTLGSIAFEKAGIFRKEKPAIINHKKPLPSLLKITRELKSKVSILNSDYSLINNGRNLDYLSDISSYDSLPLPKVEGNHQITNLAGALRCLDFIKHRFPINREQIIKGINNTFIKGRFQIINQQPFIVADVAHNEEASLNLALALKQNRLNGKIKAVFSILSDKDIKKVVGPFIEMVDEWYIAETLSSRTASKAYIKKNLQDYKNTLTVYSYESINDAYQEALNNSHVNDNIVVFGSFFVISEIFNK